MGAIKLFGTRNRDEAHRQLEEVLAGGQHPRASCREDTDDPNEPYTVWSDGPDPYIRPPDPPAPAPMSEDQMLDRLMDKLLARLKAKGEV